MGFRTYFDAGPYRLTSCGSTNDMDARETCGDTVPPWQRQVGSMGVCWLVLWLVAVAPAWSQEPSPEPEASAALDGDPPSDPEAKAQDAEDIGQEGSADESAEQDEQDEQDEQATVPRRPFFEQEPYDLITLDAANNNEVLKVMPLPFADRKLPEPAKRAGRLKIRLFDQREDEYEVMWRHIAGEDGIVFFEQLVLREAEQLVQQAFQIGRAGQHAESKSKFDEAYEFFHWLMVHHPDVDGLDRGIQDYLYLNAGTLFLIGAQRETEAAAAQDQDQINQLRKRAFDKYARAVGILEELVSQNPRYTYGTTKNTAFALLERVADRLLAWYQREGNFVAVRSLLERLQKQHKDRLGVGRTWQDRLIAEAASRRDTARQHMQAQRYAQAHEAAGEMLKIWPRLPGGRDLVVELSRVYPLVVVSVSQPALTVDPTSLDNFASRRAGHLVYPTLIEFQERGPEGGRYASPFGSVQQSDDRMQLIFDLRNTNSDAPFTGYDLSRNLLAMTDPYGDRYDPAWSSLVSTIQVEEVMRVRAALRHPHVLPQAVLRSQFHVGDQIASRYTFEQSEELESRFVPIERMSDSDQPRPVIVERFHEQPRAAIEDLRRGRIDMIDRLLPADALRLRQEAGIQIGVYAFPTLMMLAVNTENPFLANRTFRRALVYGINRQVILEQGLFNGQLVEGSRVISAPLPAGISKNDPSAYAYDERVTPYPYDPVMASILVGLATQQLQAVAEQREEPGPELEELVLAHPFGELHRFIARQIQMQLEVFDIPCQLRELEPGQSRVPDDQYDLLLMEFQMFEPLVDVPRLLGERGVVPAADPYVNLSLRRLYESENWRSARENLYELHRMLQNDATLIPLWQMTEFFAYHDGLRGIRQRPIFFYQDAERWRIVPPEPTD